MTVSWTLEGELVKLAATDSLASALAILGMADSDDEFALRTIQDWYRSGTETYSLRFSVSNLSHRSEFILKACVAYSGGQPLKEILANWHRAAASSTVWV